MYIDSDWTGLWDRVIFKSLCCLTDPYDCSIISLSLSLSPATLERLQRVTGISSDSSAIAPRLRLRTFSISELVYIRPFRTPVPKPSLCQGTYAPDRFFFPMNVHAPLGRLLRLRLSRESSAFARRLPLRTFSII